MLMMKWENAASGTATVLEVFRVLTKNGYRGNRTLEFHAYAAEEVRFFPIWPDLLACPDRLLFWKARLVCWVPKTLLRATLERAKRLLL